MKKLILITLSVIVIGSLIFSGCSTPTPTPASTPISTPTATPTATVASTPTPTTATSVAPTTVAPVKGGVLRIQRRETPDTPVGDVQAMGPRTNESEANIVFQPLCYYKPSGELVPIIATAFDPAPDQTYLDITVRQGVKFHDGTVCNAAAVKWNLDRFMKVKPSKDPQWKSIEVLSDYKLRVNLNYWTNTLYSGMAGQLIGSPDGFLKNGDEWGGLHPAGTGPFKFVEYQRDVKMTFARFDDYWDKGKPYMDGIVNIYLADPMTAQMAFEAGQLDLCYLFLGKQASELKALGFPNNQLSSALCPIHALVPSSANPASPLSNLKVRQAISLAFDRKTICDSLGYTWLTPIQQMAPVDSPAYIPELEKNESYNTAKAKQLLVDAGYPNGIKTKLIMPPQWANAELASALQAQLAKIGVTADIEFPEAGKFTQYRWTNSTTAFEGLIFQEFINWAVYTMNPSYYWWRAGATPQYFACAYPAGFDDLVSKLIKTTTIEKPLIQQFEKALYDDTTVIPLYQLHMAAFFQPKVHTNFMAFSFKTDWLPSDTWIEK